MPKEPYFVAVGAWVEDRRDNRPDVCRVFYGDESEGFDDDGNRYPRSRAEACELARKIAALLNEFYPRANNAPRAKKETA